MVLGILEKSATGIWLKNMKTASLAEVKDQFSKHLDQAAKEQIIITRHGKPAAGTPTVKAEVL